MAERKGARPVFGSSGFFGIVNEMASRAVGAEADCVECSAEFGFVFGVPH